MHNLEVWNMALSKEREVDRGRRRLEQSRHVQEAIARPMEMGRERSGRGGGLRRLWHVANGVLHCRWTGPRLRRGEGFHRATT